MMSTKKKTNYFYSIIIIIIILISICVILIQNQIKEHHMQDDPMLFNLRYKLNTMFDNKKIYKGNLEKLNDGNIMDSIGLYKGNKSYTINKEKIFLCLFDEQNKYYNTQFLMYVLLHEISHVLCDEIGHTKKFNEIFEELLIEAVDQGIYDPSTPMIQNYCTYND